MRNPIAMTATEFTSIMTTPPVSSALPSGAVVAIELPIP